MRKAGGTILTILKLGLMGGGLLAVLIWAGAVVDHVRFSDQSPPGDMRTISDFRGWQPSYVRAYRVEVRGSVYYVVQGGFARSTPSAKAEYYFDSRGNYLTWNADPGDFTTLGIVKDAEARRTEIAIDEIGR